MNFWDYINILSIPSIHWSDIVEIILLTTIAYQVIKRLKDKRAWVVIKGLGILFLTYLAAKACKFDMFILLFNWLVSLLAFIIVLLFHTDIKNFLENLGTKKISLNFFSKKEKNMVSYYSDETIEELITAAIEMSKAKTGALIVVEKDTPLTEYIESGIKIDAHISNQLLINIFEKNTPLHDGAVVLRKDRIEAATCLLKLSENNKIDKHLGTRHRAAIGTTETSDCFVIVVSEETGKISFVKNGKYTSGLTEKQLRNALKKEQSQPTLDEKVLSGLKEDKKWTNNLSTKIAVLACVFTFWIITINSTNPVITRTFTSDLNIINGESLTNIGQAYEIPQDTEIKVFVKGRRSDIDHISKENIIVEADAEKMSITNAVPISAKVNTLSPEKYEISTDISTINLKVEKIVDFEVPIEIVTNGNPAEGYIVKNIHKENDTLLVSMPESSTKIVEKAQIVIELNGESDDFITEITPIIYDKNGSKLKNIINYDNISLEIDIEAIKDVAVNLEISNNMSKKYEIKEVYPVSEVISIIGPKEILDGINEINALVDVDVPEDSITTIIKSIDIQLPKDISTADGQNKINVAISLDNIQEEKIHLTDKDIKALNTFNNLAYSCLDKEIDVVIKGLKTKMSEVDIDELSFYVDVKEITEAGEYSLPLKVDNADIVFSQPVLIKVLVG